MSPPSRRISIHDHSGFNQGGDLARGGNQVTVAPVTTTHPNLSEHDALGLATDAELAAHAAAADPHPAYALDSDLSTHVGASDPHTGYQRESEKGAANGYAGLGAGGLVPIAQLASGAPDGTKYIRDDGTLVAPAGTTVPADYVDPATATAGDIVTALIAAGLMAGPPVGGVHYWPMLALTSN